MRKKLKLEILSQPDDTTCGPTSLHAVYNYYNDNLNLNQLISEVKKLNTGGTLAVLLGNHALKRGYKAKIYTFNLSVFDPTWFSLTNNEIIEKLKKQLKYKHNPKFKFTSKAYQKFLELGGEIKYQDLTAGLIRKYLRKSTPILTGLSATYLYGTAREFGPNSDYNDIKGFPAGHFVVLCGYDKNERTVDVADPLFPNPVYSKQYYSVKIDRLICAILLGVITYDANLLIIEKEK